MESILLDDESLDLLLMVADISYIILLYLTFCEREVKAYRVRVGLHFLLRSQLCALN